MRKKKESDRDSRNLKKNVKDSSRRNLKMMKQTEFFEESWQRKKPREKLKKLDSSKRLN